MIEVYNAQELIHINMVTRNKKKKNEQRRQHKVIFLNVLIMNTQQISKWNKELSMKANLVSELENNYVPMNNLLEWVLSRCEWGNKVILFHHSFSCVVTMLCLCICHCKQIFNYIIIKWLWWLYMWLLKCFCGTGTSARNNSEKYASA